MAWEGGQDAFKTDSSCRIIAPARAGACWNCPGNLPGAERQDRILRLRARGLWCVRSEPRRVRTHSAHPQSTQGDRLPSGRILDLFGQDAAPHWSADERKLVFSRDRALSDGDIYTANADGSGLTALTMGTPSDEDPAWSPDGRKIAFTQSQASLIPAATGYSPLTQTGRSSFS